MKNIEVEVDWPPSANKNWMIRRGRFVSTDAAACYKRLIKDLSYTWEKITFLKDIEITIKAFPPDKRKRDIDNLLKVTLDSLQNTHLFENDEQIRKITIERMHKCDKGKLQIRLEGE